MQAGEEMPVQTALIQVSSPRRSFRDSDQKHCGRSRSLLKSGTCRIRMANGKKERRGCGKTVEEWESSGMKTGERTRRGGSVLPTRCPNRLEKLRAKVLPESPDDFEGEQEGVCCETETPGDNYGKKDMSATVVIAPSTTIGCPLQPYPCQQPYMPPLYGQMMPMMGYCPMYPPTMQYAYLPMSQPYMFPFVPPAPQPFCYPPADNKENRLPAPFSTARPSAYTSREIQSKAVSSGRRQQRSMVATESAVTANNSNRETTTNNDVDCGESASQNDNEMMVLEGAMSASVPTSGTKDLRVVKEEKEVKEYEKAPPVLLNFDLNVPNAKAGTLAELFQKKKREIAARIFASKAKQQRKEKTKEELILRRKEMLKCQRRSPSMIEPAIKLGANQALMSRLAAGKRREMSKEEMLKLTQRNYQMLPEVVKKKEEERKRLEKLARVRNARKMEKVKIKLVKKGSRTQENSCCD